MTENIESTTESTPKTVTLAPTFAELGVRPETVAALAAMGIERAFAIQEYALPIALRGGDMIGQAPTGTGKTFGFGIPLIDHAIAPGEGESSGQPQALVVVPTRELGLQVAKDLAGAGRSRGVRVLALYGGVAYEPQVDALKAGVEIVVSTPGRLLDLCKQKHLKLDQVKALVLDEADRMLDLGFLDDVEKILKMLPEDRQTMLFSATMPDPIVTLSRKFLRTPVTVHAGHTTEPGVSPQTKQVVYRTHQLNKLELLARILQAQGRGLTMIFTRTKRNADRVSEDLDFRGFAAAAVHGDLGQGARERALRAFRAGKVDVLVATDVAARGLDVSGVTHVINYDCPDDAETYVHRIGRTGRAGATGVAVTFVDWEDMPRWRIVDKTLGLELTGPDGPAETYHTSPWVYTDLDIPTDVSGTLPSAQRSRAGLSAEVEEDLGGRSRGSRDRGKRGPAAEQAAPPRERAPRRRRRLAGDDDAAPVAEAGAQDAPADTPDAEGEAGRGRRRRRGRGAGTGAAVAASVTHEGGLAPLFAAPPDGSDGPAEPAEAAEGGASRSRSRRRRRRGGSGGPAEGALETSVES
ncbi:DEAD/DEAH box helicase [Catellatospora chokoriensis]|uniref:RNA helicase n=1 Tax=Catellatospora chokoriensis TaxID=310353 RepID=A0A8J3K586_9ACTN|nr:DEAD/DEAH box helicase [Catellatospora chokoriensis]GIF89719.1 DEAD/DEAH box helicase [Catellatospora chokoriensis]